MGFVTVRQAMTDEPDLPTNRDSPVGTPVVRGEPELDGAEKATDLDPESEESLDRAAQLVSEFASTDAGSVDSLAMLQGAGACAVLVRGEGSYSSAAARAGDGVSVSFVRTWARVHDLPRAVRRHVALGEIVPSAAKHIARLTGMDRLSLAWAVIDHELTVREVRAVVSDVRDGSSVESALASRGYAPGEITIQLPTEEYCLLRQEASLAGQPPGEVVADLFRES